MSDVQPSSVDPRHSSCSSLIALTQMRMPMIPLRMSIMLSLLGLAMCMPDSFSRICLASMRLNDAQSDGSTSGPE